MSTSDPALARHYAAEAEVLTDDIAAPEDQASALTLIGMAVAGVDATYAESLADKAQARVLSDEDYGPMICIALALAAAGAANSSIGIPADASPQYDFNNYARSLIRMGRLEQAKRVLLEYRDEAGLAEDLAWGLIRAGQ